MLVCCAFGCGMLFLPFLEVKIIKVRMAVMRRVAICAPFLRLGIMVARGFIAVRHRSLGAAGGEYALHGCVSGLGMWSGGWWLSHICGPGALGDVVLSLFLVEVVLFSRGLGVRQCLPWCFWWYPQWLVMRVS